MNRPSFFIVGAAQCGSTALCESLRQHPEIFMPHSEDSERYWVRKEPFHFCGDLGVTEWSRVVREDDYLALFSKAPEGARCGTATAWKMFSQEAPVRIKEFEPQAKIVMMLCPPVTWMRSWHHELLRHAYEVQVDFGQALEVEKERAEGRKMPCRNASGNCLQYRKAARFSEQVERYFEVFGRENVFVGLRDDLEKDPSSFYKSLLEFLEVDSSVQLEGKQTSDSEALCGTYHFDLAVARTVGRLPGGAGLKKLFSKSLQQRYRKLADRIFAPMSDQSINSILEEELLEEFEPEVARLGKLLDRDLSHWNEPRFPRSENEHHHHHH